MAGDGGDRGARGSGEFQNPACRFRAAFPAYGPPGFTGPDFSFDAGSIGWFAAAFDAIAAPPRRSDSITGLSPDRFSESPASPAATDSPGGAVTSSRHVRTAAGPTAGG